MSDSTCRDCGRPGDYRGPSKKPCCKRNRCAFCQARHNTIKHPPMELRTVVQLPTGTRVYKKPYYHRLWWFGQNLHRLERSV